MSSFASTNYDSLVVGHGLQYDGVHGLLESYFADGHLQWSRRVGALTTRGTLILF